MCAWSVSPGTNERDEMNVRPKEEGFVLVHESSERRRAFVFVLF